MRLRLRFSLLNGLLIATCIALAIGWWATVEPPKPPAAWNALPTDYGIRELPLTISMSEQGGWGGGWYFTVNSAGDAELTILHSPKDIVQSVKVTSTQLSELRELLVREQFFELKDEYGDLVPDGGSQHVMISVGEWSKSLQLNFLGNWVIANETEKLQEPARELRVWMLIRDWFQHPDALDSRSHDQRVINAASGGATDGN